MQINRDCPNCGARSSVYVGNFAPNTFVVGIWRCGKCQSPFELTEEEIKMAQDEFGNPVPDNHGVMPGQPVFDGETVEGEEGAMFEEVFPSDAPVGPTIDVLAEEVNINETPNEDDADAKNEGSTTVGAKNPVKDTEDDNVATRRGRPRSK